MTAYARVIPPGHDSDAVCEPCEWVRRFPRTEAALAAVRAHNRDRHAYPEHTLEIDTGDADR